MSHQSNPRTNAKAESRKRRIIALACACAIAPVCTASLSIAGPELLPNGSFEALEDANAPKGWTPDFPVVQGEEPPAFFIAPQQFYEGRRSACVVNANPDVVFFNNWLARLDQFPSGGWVRLTGRVRTRHVSEAAFAVLQCWTSLERGRYRIPHRSTEVRLDELRNADWLPFDVTAFVPTSTTLVTVRCGLVGTGAAWFDALSLRQVEPPVPHVGENLISNPGGEDGDSAPLSWNTGGPFDQVTEFRWPTDVSHSGQRSLYIGAESGSAFRWWEHWVPRLPGAGLYRLSGFIRTRDLPSTSRAMLVLNVYDDAGRQVALARTFGAQDLSGSRGWTQVRAETQVAEGAECARILAFLGGPGRVWFDDLRLVAVAVQ
ncbi:MAG: hypothetical protein ACE5O2_00505 [Armatimonadota bacterium]